MEDRIKKEIIAYLLYAMPEDYNKLVLDGLQVAFIDKWHSIYFQELSTLLNTKYNDGHYFDDQERDYHHSHIAMGRVFNGMVDELTK